MTQNGGRTHIGIIEKKKHNQSQLLNLHSQLFEATRINLYRKVVSLQWHLQSSTAIESKGNFTSALMPESSPRSFIKRGVGRGVQRGVGPQHGKDLRMWSVCAAIKLRLRL